MIRFYNVGVLATLRLEWIFTEFLWNFADLKFVPFSITGSFACRQHSTHHIAQVLFPIRQNAHLRFLSHPIETTDLGQNRACE